MTPIETQDGASFVVEAMVVNTNTMKTNWKEIARYPDRETAELVRDMNRRKGIFCVREEKPANSVLGHEIAKDL